MLLCACRFCSPIRHGNYHENNSWTRLYESVTPLIDTKAFKLVFMPALN